MPISLSPREVAAVYRDLLPGLKQAGKEWRGHCPVHDGADDNFTVNPETGYAYCHSQCRDGWDPPGLIQKMQGCDFPKAADRISQIIGRDVLASNGNHSAKAEEEPQPEKYRYPYHDETGKLLSEVVRQEQGQGARRKKSFRQRRPDGNGGWIHNLDGVRRVLYGLPSIPEAKTVIVVEGEKCADSLNGELKRSGLFGKIVATTSPEGAGKWRPEFAEALRNKHVIILPDADSPGQKHALQVADSSLPFAKSVRVVELSGLLPKGDIVDWLDLGHTAKELQALARETPKLDESRLEQLRERWTPKGERVHGSGDNPAGAIEPAALYGLAGDFVRLVKDESEADCAALLFQFLVAVGIYLGRSCFYQVEHTIHHLNLFCVIVGDSSKARKGTSWDHVSKVLSMADEQWAHDHLSSGLSSGEGLIWAVRDEIRETKIHKESGSFRSEEVVVDKGIKDKRLLVVESEFARVLQVMGRESNVLSAVIRQAWDKGNLAVLTKQQPARASDAHIGIVGHITQEELKRRLTETESANGFANRFLWVYSRRSKCLPFGGNVPIDALRGLAERLRSAAAFAATTGRVEFGNEARRMWEAAYAELSEGKPGLSGAVTSRGEAQVVRLAALYAVLDLSDAIRGEHLRAALAAWEYAEASAERIFGGSLGDSTADAIQALLQRAGDTGCTREEITNHFGRHKPANEIIRALGMLRARQLARQEWDETGGRKAEHWYPRRPCEESEKRQGA